MVKAVLCLYYVYERAVDFSNAESVVRNTGLILFNKYIVLNNANYVFNCPQNQLVQQQFRLYKQHLLLAYQQNPGQQVAPHHIKNRTNRF